MLSYHNDQSIKDKYIKQLKKTKEMFYGDCEQLEDEIGIPAWLACLAGELILKISLDAARKFPLLFFRSIKVGVDLEKIKAPFLIFVLKSALENLEHSKGGDVKKFVENVINLYETKCEDNEKFMTAACDASNEVLLSFDANKDFNKYSYAAWSAYYAAKSSFHIACLENGYRLSSVSMAFNYSALTIDSIAIRKGKYNKFADKLLELLANAD